MHSELYVLPAGPSAVKIQDRIGSGSLRSRWHKSETYVVAVLCAIATICGFWECGKFAGGDILCDEEIHWQVLRFCVFHLHALGRERSRLYRQ